MGIPLSDCDFAPRVGRTKSTSAIDRGNHNLPLGLRRSAARPIRLATFAELLVTANARGPAATKL